jgi:hypothetical protein
MRIRSLYAAPFRIRRRPANQPEPDCGEVLTPDKALSPIGPLNGAGPGDLSRWMAVPWQTDTASCLSGYSFFNTSPSLPTFWPARVPNQVLSAQDFSIVMDPNAKPEARLAAFYRRENWFRIFNHLDETGIELMIKNFGKLGIVEERKGPSDLPVVPGKVWVESEPGKVAADTAPAAQARTPVAERSVKGAKPAPNPRTGNPPSFERLRRFGKERIV